MNFTAVVKALVADGAVRRRAGRVWSALPVTVRVVAGKPSAPDEVTLEDFRTIERDPYLVVSHAGAEVGAALLHELDANLQRLRRKLSGAAETLVESRGQAWRPGASEAAEARYGEDVAGIAEEIERLEQERAQLVRGAR